jgi:dihydrolipoamide dehydrogenase
VTDTNTDQVYDIVVLGGGSAGYATALRGAQLGLSVTLIEKAELGGTCLHRGCVPTKALLRSAEVADEAKGASAYGIRASFDGIDMPAVNSFKDGVVSRLYKGLQGLVKARKVNYVAGTGTLSGKDSVDVQLADGGSATYRGKNVVLATGSYSKTLPGLEIGGLGGRVMTSEQALTMDSVPERALILGGGVIGLEFASVWRSMGSEVTIIEGLPHLANNEDEAISKAVERAYKKRKIAFSTGTFFDHAEETENGVKAVLADGKEFEGDVLLVAVGRGPVTDGLGYEAQGIEMDRGFVLADKETLETNVPGIYAAGDIVPGLQLAHRGFQQGVFIAERIAGLDPAPIVESGIPRITYCEPEIGSVGLTEKQAKEAYGDDGVESYEYNLGGNGKSQMLQTTGFIKVVREKDGPVVGVHMFGGRMSELMGEAQVIVNWEAYPEDVAVMPHAHPSQNEAMGEAMMALAGKPLHAHN